MTDSTGNATRVHDQYWKRREKGLCRRCKKPSSFTFCSACAAWRSEQRLKRLGGKTLNAHRSAIAFMNAQTLRLRKQLGIQHAEPDELFHGRELMMLSPADKGALEITRR